MTQQQHASSSSTASSTSTVPNVTFVLPDSFRPEKDNTVNNTNMNGDEDDMFHGCEYNDNNDDEKYDHEDEIMIIDYPLTLSDSTLSNKNIPYYTGSNVGLRERTTSQSSAAEVYTSSSQRDRTMSQNSVEQLESQQQQYYKSRTNILIPSSNTTTTSKGILHSTTKYSSVQQQQRSSIDQYTNRTTTTTTLSNQQHQQKYQLLRSSVEYIQSLRVPIWLLRRYRQYLTTTTSTTSTSTNSTTTTKIGTTMPLLKDIGGKNDALMSQKQQESSTSMLNADDSTVNSTIDIDTTIVYWISGLDRVLFTKESCCAQDIRIMNWKPPKYLWYMISGGLCDVIQLGILYLIHTYVIRNQSICWMVAFCISILFRHTFHRYLVFGNYIGGYIASLLRMYTGYSVTIVLSTIVNYILSHIFEVNVFVLAILTMGWTGVVNYFILKYFWNFGSTNNNNSVSTATTNIAS